MPTYKLVYFDGKGRAETTRLAFHACGVQFEDVRISKEDWPNLKPRTISGQLPYLEVDGKELAESMAIARFVGREFGLMGKSNFEQAVIDSAMETISELLEKGVVARMTPDGPQKEAAKKDFLEKHFPRIAEYLEKTLGNKKYLTSNELTLADLHFFSVFEFLSALTSLQDSHPKLKELSERISNHPRLADYIKNRPKSDF